MRFLVPLLLASSISLAAQSPEPASSPEPIPVSPSEALAHRIGHDKPVYTRFALAAGITFTFKVPVSIWQDGTVHSEGSVTGPPSLTGSAIAWIYASKFRPFQRNGQPVSVTTTLPVVFQLSPGAHSAHPPVALYPRNISSTIEREGPDSPPRARWSMLSPAIHDWIARYEAGFASGKQLDESVSLDETIARENDAPPLVRTPGNLAIYQIPLALPHHSLYLLFEFSDRCDKSNNCPMILLEESPTGVHAAVSEFGIEADLHRRHDSPYPDVLIWADSGAAGISDISGFSYYGGQWGQLYCGTHDANEEFERDEQIADRHRASDPMPPLVTLCK
jgi:hypothetical protein